MASAVESKSRCVALLPDVVLMPEVGMMPVEWSGALDPGQIWSSLGFFFLTFLLLWSELEVVEKSIVPFNKSVVRGHRSVWRRGADELLPDIHGDQGKKQVGTLFFASGRWRGSVLQGIKSPVQAICAW